MQKFKPGDKVKVKTYCSGLNPDKIYSLILHNGDLYATIEGLMENGSSLGCSCQSNWILVESYNKFENIKQYGLVKFCKENYK